jgi:ribosomal peptide maturation radical SAM protein 1
MKKIRTAIVSPPWMSHIFPSLATGTLAAFAESRGHRVLARNLHLDVARRFGFDDYAAISYDTCVEGEAMFAAILFPEARERIASRLSRRMKGAGRLISRMERCLSEAYAALDLSGCRIIGFTANYQQLFASVLLARWVRRDIPDAVTVIGGRLVFGELGASVIRSFPEVDFCVDGEGELPLVQMIRSLESGDEDLPRRVPSLICRDGGRIITTPRRQLRDLGGLPDPDYDDFFQAVERIRRRGGGEFVTYLPIEESRGCPHGCYFCSERPFWQGYRARPARQIAESVRRLTERHRVPRVRFVSQLVSRRSAGRLFPLIARQRRDYRMICEIRAGASREELSAMKSAGVSEVLIGIEAIDTALLRKMNKGTRLIDNLEVMRHCEEIGLRYTANMMLGFPSETQDDVDRSVEAVRFASAYRPPDRINTFSLLDASDAYREASRFGIADIGELSSLTGLLPARIRSSIRTFNKEFRTTPPRRDYRALVRAIENWRAMYDNLRYKGLSPLQYFDGGDFLLIEDNRLAERSVRLAGWLRELYLFCDAIRSHDEIMRRFGRHGNVEVEASLGELFRLGLIYAEDGLCLSLAVRSERARRRNMMMI